MIDRKVLVVFGLALASLMVLSNAHASEIDQSTKLTFSQSVQVPGHVLPAGTYLFLVDTSPNSNTVRIFSPDRSTLYATLMTIPAQLPNQSDVSGETEITFADRGSMQPEAIITWFYPGRTVGHQFQYSQKDRKEIAQANLVTIISGD